MVARSLIVVQAPIGILIVAASARHASDEPIALLAIPLMGLFLLPSAAVWRFSIFYDDTGLTLRTPWRTNQIPWNQLDAATVAPFDLAAGTTQVLVVRETDGTTHQTLVWSNHSPLVIGTSGVQYLSERINAALRTHHVP